MRIELLSVPNCPHADFARHLLRDCLTTLHIQAEIQEMQGPYPSPTVLVDGRDVMGAPLSSAAACRLDIPTRERIMAALGGTPKPASCRPG